MPLIYSNNLIIYSLIFFRLSFKCCPELNTRNRKNLRVLLFHCFALEEYFPGFFHNFVVILDGYILFLVHKTEIQNLIGRASTIPSNFKQCWKIFSAGSRVYYMYKNYYHWQIEYQIYPIVVLEKNEPFLVSIFFTHPSLPLTYLTLQKKRKKIFDDFLFLKYQNTF